MIPYSRPKLSDLYTLSQSKLLKNHTVHRGTYLYSPYMAEHPRAFCPRRTESRLLIHHNYNVQPVAIILRFCLVYMSSEKVIGVCLYYRI